MPNFVLFSSVSSTRRKPFSTHSVSLSSTTLKFKIFLTVPSTTLVYYCLISPKLLKGLTLTGSCTYCSLEGHLFGSCRIAAISSSGVVSFIRSAPPSAPRWRSTMELIWAGPLAFFSFALLWTPGITMSTRFPMFWLTVATWTITLPEVGGFFGSRVQSN